MQQQNKRTRNLEPKTLDGYGRNIELFSPTREDLATLTARFTEQVPSSATVADVLRIYDCNQDTVVTFRNKITNHEGVVVFLPLNSAGHIALAEGQFDFATPSARFICRTHEKPVSIYVWAIGICPKTGGGIEHVMKLLSEPKYANATLYCRAANSKAEKFFLSLGFQKGVLINGRWRTDLMAYFRPLNAASNDNPTNTIPSYDSYDPAATNAGRIGVKVVHSIDEFLQVHTIRSATYIAEQEIPYSEDIDGNDFSGSHLIAYVGNEPAACLRLRYFSEFVKFERLAVMPRFRSRPVALRLVRAGIDFAREKGFTRFYGHTENATAPVWRRVGFVMRETKGITCSDREFFEGDLIVSPSSDPITPNTNPYVIIRPEGKWHSEGILDKSAARGHAVA